MYSSILGLDKATDVNFFDLILAVLFVASAYLCVFTAPAGLTNSIVPFLLIVFGLSIGSAMLIRAILYNKGKGYTNPAHRIRTYFKTVYDEYDVTIPLFCGLVVVLLVLIGAGKLYGDSTFIFNRVWKAAASDGAIMALYIIALVIGLCGVVLTLVFRKFKAQSAVRTDDILVGLLFASFFVVLYGIVMLAFTKFDFFGNTANIILFIGYALIFVYSALVQFIRLKQFEPIQALSRWLLDQLLGCLPRLRPRTKHPEQLLQPCRFPPGIRRESGIDDFTSRKKNPGITSTLC